MNHKANSAPAGLYARVFSDRQDVDLSVADQPRALPDYAKNNGYTVAREYADEAGSGRIFDGLLQYITRDSHYSKCINAA